MIVVVAGIVAGTLATCAQLLLWFAAGKDAWVLLLRDSHLTAALVLGSTALSPAAVFDFRILLVATVVHFFLSILYAAVMLPVAKRLMPVQSILAGIGIGALLYFLNLYGFTEAFPWFTAARGGITLAAHCIFGVAVMLTYKLFGRSPPSG